MTAPAGGDRRDDRSCDASLRCAGANDGAAVGYNGEYFRCVASLFRASGAEVGRWTLRATAWDGPLSGSARLDPRTVGVLRDLAAGDYVLCLREPNRGAVSYALAVGVPPRSW